VSPSVQRESAYAVQAGRLIAQALESESQGDYEEAFDLMKAGVDVLLNGVQSELVPSTCCRFNFLTNFQVIFKNTLQASGFLHKGNLHSLI